MDKKQPLERHFSAGGIIFKKEDGEVKVLLTQHSSYKGWGFPKGQIEKGEGSQETALREVKEETGVVAKILEKLGNTQYFFYQDKKRIFKTVTWFLMNYLSEGEASHGWEVSQKKWLKLGEVEKQLTYKDDKDFWRKNFDKIQKLTVDF